MFSFVPFKCSQGSTKNMPVCEILLCPFQQFQVYSRKFLNLFFWQALLSLAQLGPEDLEERRFLLVSKTIFSP